MCNIMNKVVDILRVILSIAVQDYAYYTVGVTNQSVNFQIQHNSEQTLLHHLDQNLASTITITLSFNPILKLNGTDPII